MSWTEEPGGLHSTGSQRAGHDLATTQQPQLPQNMWSSAAQLVPNILRRCPAKVLLLCIIWANRRRVNWLQKQMKASFFDHRMERSEHIFFHTSQWAWLLCRDLIGGRGGAGLSRGRGKCNVHAPDPVPGAASLRTARCSHLESWGQSSASAWRLRCQCGHFAPGTVVWAAEWGFCLWPPVNR